MQKASYSLEAKDAFCVLKQKRKNIRKALNDNQVKYILPILLLINLHAIAQHKPAYQIFTTEGKAVGYDRMVKKLSRPMSFFLVNFITILLYVG